MLPGAKKVQPADVPSTHWSQGSLTPPRPWDGRGRVDATNPTRASDGYLPLEDPANLAASDAPAAFLTNQMDIANEQQTN
jgi:hypothetical protein